MLDALERLCQAPATVEAIAGFADHVTAIRPYQQPSVGLGTQPSRPRLDWDGHGGALASILR